MAKKSTAATDTTLPCGVTEEQIAQWKKEFGNDKIFVIEVTHEGVVISGIYREPDFNALNKAMVHLMPDPTTGQPREPLMAGYVALLECELAVDDQVEKIESVKSGFAIQMLTKLQIKKAQIKNL